MKIDKINIEDLKKELKIKGYNKDEIQHIAEGVEDMNEGRFCTMEEVYKSLFAKKKVHVHA